MANVQIETGQTVKIGKTRYKAEESAEILASLQEVETQATRLITLGCPTGCVNVRNNKTYPVRAYQTAVHVCSDDGPVICSRCGESMEPIKARTKKGKV